MIPLFFKPAFSSPFPFNSLFAGFSVLGKAWFFGALFIALCGLSLTAKAEWFHQQHNAMGTRISVTVWHQDGNVAKSAMDAVMAEMQRIDNEYSPYKDDSALSRLNRLAAKQPQAISDEMAILLKRANAVSELTEGAFDISYASVGHLYNYRQQRQPSDKDRLAKQAAVDYRGVIVQQGKVRFAHPDLVIDLGGLAKGYAADRAIDILQGYGIRHASFSAGGDSRLLGDRRGRPWMVGIKHPRKADDIAITLPLDNTAVSTSGDYERFFIDQKTGERVHHIINPKSGASAKGVISVTILGPTGLETDPLSTSVFVLGVERGLALVNSISNVDAIIIDDKGKVHYSDGLSQPSN